MTPEPTWSQLIMKTCIEDKAARDAGPEILIMQQENGRYHLTINGKSYGRYASKTAAKNRVSDLARSETIPGLSEVMFR